MDLSYYHIGMTRRIAKYKIFSWVLLSNNKDMLGWAWAQKVKKDFCWAGVTMPNKRGDF